MQRPSGESELGMFWGTDMTGEERGPSITGKGQCAFVGAVQIFLHLTVWVQEGSKAL